jgi:hypothetical protein
MKKIFFFLICCLFSVSALADTQFDLGFAYSADTLHKTTDNSNTSTFYNVDVLFNLDNRKAWNVGWTVFGISQTAAVGSTTTTYSSMDMGPVLRWNIDRAGMFSTTLAYGYLARGTYGATGATDEKWEGTSYLAQLAAQIPLGEKFYMGVSLNYYGASYSTKTVSNVESTNDSTKTWIFPMFSMTWKP